MAPLGAPLFSMSSPLVVGEIELLLWVHAYALCDAAPVF